MAADENFAPTPHLTFGEFRLDCNLKRLYRGTDELVKLTPKPFSTLEFLIGNRQRVVSKEELLSRVWREQRDQNTVDQAVGKLRKALGDDVARPRYIETVPGQGYHFIATVLTRTVEGETTTRDVPEDATPLAPSARRPVAAFPDGSPALDSSGALNADHVPVATSARARRRARAIVLGGLSAVAFGGFFVYRLMHEPNPQQATVVGTELTALDGSGHRLWHRSLPHPLLGLTEDLATGKHLNGHTYLEDLHGDGKNEVLVAAAYGRDTAIHDEIYCYTASGGQAWSYQPHVEFSFVGRHASGPWKLHALTVVPDGRKKAIWAAFIDPMFAPTFVVSVDAEGKSQVRYISSGHVNALTSLSNERGTFILAGGINNEYRAASFAVLDSRQPAAVSPQTPGNRFQCTNCPSGRPLLFVVLPRSEVNLGSGMPYNWIDALQKRDGKILLETHEQKEASTNIAGFFELSDQLLPRNISFGAGYKEAHDRLEKLGLIGHKWSDCQEQKHPATARVWDESHGWREIQIPWVH